ncbi:MAG: hypothetical protein E3J81_10115, partial [Dehalococcoidia bacterium]
MRQDVAGEMSKLTSLARAFMVVVLIAAGFLQFYVVNPQVTLASPAEYLTYPSFTGGTTGWTLSVTIYDSVTYQDTAGSIETHPATGRNKAATGTCTQTISASISSSDIVNLSLYWKKSIGVEMPPTLQILEVQIKKPSMGDWSTPVTIWSDTQIGDIDWTSVGPVNVSSYFDETGTYEYRYYMDTKTGNSANAETHIWVDNTSLDVTPPVVEKSVSQGITISDGATATLSNYRTVTQGIAISDGVTAAVARGRD